jgi:hypothetical protein
VKGFVAGGRRPKHPVADAGQNRRRTQDHQCGHGSPLFGFNTGPTPAGHSQPARRRPNLMFTAVSAPEHHTAIESMIQQVCHDEAALAPLVQSLEVRVTVANREGDLVKEYVLAKSAPAKAAKAKLWWRFW